MLFISLKNFLYLKRDVISKNGYCFQSQNLLTRRFCFDSSTIQRSLFLQRIFNWSGEDDRSSALELLDSRAGALDCHLLETCETYLKCYVSLMWQTRNQIMHFTLFVTKPSERVDRLIAKPSGNQVLFTFKWI